MPGASGKSCWGRLLRLPCGPAGWFSYFVLQKILPGAHACAPYQNTTCSSRVGRRISSDKRIRLPFLDAFLDTFRSSRDRFLCLSAVPCAAPPPANMASAVLSLYPLLRRMIRSSLSSATISATGAASVLLAPIWCSSTIYGCKKAGAHYIRGQKMMARGICC